MNITVYIERLVFDGLPIASGEAAFVQAAVEAEMRRLLANELFAPASSFAEASVTTGEIHVHPGTTARDLGVEIGRSVFHGLTQSGFGLPREANRSPRGGFGGPARERGSSELLQTIQPENRSRPGGDLRSGTGSVFGLNTNQQPKEMPCQHQK